jgi:thiamine biosynthesis lipoprotein
MDTTAIAQPVTTAFAAMGTEVTLSLWPDAGREAQAKAALEHEVAFLHRAEQHLSRFLPSSEISRLNLAEGAPVNVSKLAFDAITAAIKAAKATGGLFDPTIHDALVAAGYDRSFDTLAGHVPGRPATPCATAGSMCGRYPDIRLDRRSRTVPLPKGVRLDLGGIAKGWLADQVARRLGGVGAALADLGGDIAACGLPPHEATWRIGLVVEDCSTDLLGQIALIGGGVATSGVARRRWQTAEGWQHHLIDPRVGKPALTDLISATVVASSAMVAEAAAKAVLLLGCAAGIAALDATPGLGAVLVRADRSVRTAGLISWHPAAGVPLIQGDAS